MENNLFETKNKLESEEDGHIDLDYDFNGISLNILKKLKESDPACINSQLLSIAKNAIFEYHPELFNFILTQTNPQSQMIIFEAINSKFIVNKNLIDLLIRYKNDPCKQRRILAYGDIPEIMHSDYYLLAMLSIENEYVESKMRKCFHNKLITREDDFNVYKNMYDKQLKLKLGAKKIFGFKI